MDLLRIFIGFTVSKHRLVTASENQQAQSESDCRFVLVDGLRQGTTH